MRCATLLPLVLLLCSVVVFADDFEEPPPPTDKDIKKMKVKDLKSWLGDRGLECKDCFEKGDFTKMVKNNRDAKLLPSKRPRKVSKEPIADQWKKVVQEICAELKADEKQTKALSTVVHGSFEQHARRISKQLSVDQKEIAKISMGEPYFAAGAKIIKQTLNWMIKKKVTSQGKIRPKVDDRIKMYLTAVGAQNVNPMYDITKEKDEL